MIDLLKKLLRKNKYFSGPYKNWKIAETKSSGYDSDEIFNKVAYIATPTAPGPAFKLGEKQDPLSLYLEDIFTVSANLAGIPAISVPFASVEKEGKQLPVGIQFMSQKKTDYSLFPIAEDLMGER